MVEIVQFGFFVEAFDWNLFLGLTLTHCPNSIGAAGIIQSSALKTAYGEEDEAMSFKIVHLFYSWMSELSTQEKTH